MTRRKAFIWACAAGAWTGWRLWQRRRVHRLRGRVAVVTGGSRGLGYGVADRLAAAGCAVAICARTAEEVHAAGLELSRHGNGVLAWVCDVSDARAVQDFITRVEQHFGRIDILVNNASIIQAGPITDMTCADFAQAMEIDFLGTVHATLAALPGMRRRRDGAIVNVTSVGGEIVIPHLLPYSCAKAAALAFSEGLTSELAGSGIDVVTVIPWLMRTGSIPYIFFKGDKDRELAVFSVGQKPFLSVAGGRAADRIVRALLLRQRRVRIGVLAMAAEKAHALAPGLVTRLLGGVNRLLPEARETPSLAVRGRTLTIGQ